MDMLVEVTEKQIHGPAVETLVLSAIAKIARRASGGLSPNARAFVEQNAKSKFVEKQQRALEVDVLVGEETQILSGVIAPSAVDVNVDASLSMLNQ